MSSWSWSTVPVWGRPWIPSVHSVCWKELLRRGRKNPQVSFHLSSFFLVLRESPKEICVPWYGDLIKISEYCMRGNICPLYFCPIYSCTQLAKLRLGEFKHVDKKKYSFHIFHFWASLRWDKNVFKCRRAKKKTTSKHRAKYSNYFLKIIFSSQVKTAWMLCVACFRKQLK